MRKRAPTKESIHLKAKIALYERFLFSYLPQLSALSFITRINLFDAFSRSGLNKLGSQGTPFTTYEAIRKQRQHQLKKQLPLKPYNLSILCPAGLPASSIAFDALQKANQASNSCRLSYWPLQLAEGLKQLSRQLKNQPASERNLLLLDPLGSPQGLWQELRRLGEKKASIVLCLPLRDLWQMHCKADKYPDFTPYSILKQTIDAFFPADHTYWAAENTLQDFTHSIKEAFRMDGLFYTALEPMPGKEAPAMVLLGLSPDAFMMEKMLLALQNLRSTERPAAGAQLGLFLPGNTAKASEAEIPAGDAGAEDLKLFLTEEKDNQQLYAQGLQAGLLPGQLQQILENLQAKGIIEVFDEKGRVMPGLPASCISFTAFKAPKASCSFRLKA